MKDNSKMEKHLDYVQSVINRMANNSFLIKGWAVTFISLLFVLSVRDSNSWFLVLSLIPLICFWGLDAYYLRQEKLYRKLYDAVREGVIGNYGMDARRFNEDVKSCFSIMFSKSVLPLYITITLLNVLLHLFVIIKVI